ncbi:MAG: ribonuclease E/G [PS1 clade bacterium]|uniref:Ribonuclease E/G n=1 Tax=PS1 clade bacterium TaxID=2175152 RepID=A0A937HGJ3_9PROT|nr:ribonuclease E/G [PS1 clade bacterium]
MSHEILMSVENGLLRVAQVEDGELTALQAAPMGKADADSASSGMVGQIYLARVERVVERLQAAFVDIGFDKSGFLGAREARALVPDATRDTPIEDCVESGDTVLVQVTRPPQGEKGAQVTADVTVAGRGVVLAPCRSRIAVSRQIEDEAERARLIELAEKIRAGDGVEAVDIEGMDGPSGWVLRTAAEGQDIEALAADMANVGAQWEALLERAEDTEPPSLIHEDLGPVEKALRDLVRADTSAVVVEGAAAFAVAKGFMRQNMPQLAEILSPSDDGEILFDRHDVAGQLDKALSPRVDLASGAWLMIEPTEAMTTVDVNSGSAEGDALAVNLEAAAAIAKQIRLRALGGLVAIDFIDMTDEAAHEAVLKALDGGFDGDKNAVRIGPMSEFSVVEMTRRRDVMTLSEALSQGGGGQEAEPADD